MGACIMFSFLKMTKITPIKFFPAVIFSSLLGLSACNQSEPTEASTKSEPAVEKKVSQETYPSGHFGYGETATAEQIAGWDIDIKPDGSGLPEGEGSVEDGEELFEDKCALCHGSFGEGVKNWPRLSGGEGSLREERPDKTVGSYWAYTSTLWDYIRRAMPYPAPQSLSNDEVYAITAYILNLNDLVDDEFVLNQDNLASVKMNNPKENFIPDDRPDTANTRCMENCKDPSKIIVTQLMGVAAAGDTSDKKIDSVDEVVVEKAKTLSENAMKGATTYNASCKFCHNDGVSGSPKFGDSKEWSSRQSKGMDVLYESAISGYEGDAGFMPAKGGNSTLTDDEVKAAVDFILESSL